MNKKPFIFIAVCMAAIAIFCIIKFIVLNPDKSHTDPDEGPGMVFVALQPVKGMDITSENPVAVTPGSNASFNISLDAFHYIIDNGEYSYSDGVITFENVSSSCTLYASVGTYCKLEVNHEGMGTSSITDTAFLKNGDEITVSFLPDDGYRIKSVKVNSLYQQTTDNSLTLTLSGDTLIEVVYEEIPAPPRTDFNVYIVKDGEPVVYKETLAAGALVTLPLGDADEITTSDYALIGYNTAADYSGDYYALGSTFAIGNGDVTLYPQEYKYADASDFTGKIINSRYLITGYVGTPVNGVVAIPPYIGGVPVTDIRRNSFNDLEGLTTVIFPVGMRKLDNSTVNNCNDFTTLVLPQTMESVTSKAVTSCPNFTNLRVITTLENKFETSFDAAMADKFLRLQNTEGKRIIVVAGSSTSFGLSSQMLEEAFPDYTIINFGNSYLSGMHFALQLLNNYIHEGDIIILAPEYYASTYASLDPIKSSMWHSISSNVNMLNYLNISTYTAVLDSFAESMTLIRNSIASGKLPYSNAKCMLRNNFNEYGDLASERKAANTKVFTAFPTDIITDRGMDIINSYADDFTAKGATCLFSFPAIYVKSITDTLTSGANDHLAILSQKLTENCVIISNPMDYAYTDNVFFDNYYHTTLEGAARRTTQLISDLQAYFQKKD